MLIINAETGTPNTERQVLGFLQDYSSNPGVAISGLNIPDRHRRHSTEADIVVVTPFTAAVIEVKGILEPVGGTLSCGSNGRWSMPGISGDPVHVRALDNNPLRQVSDPMFDLKDLANELEPDRELFINGLVVVVPHPGTTVSLDKGVLPQGRDVLLGADPAPLWKWLNRKAFQVREDPWTVELVIAVLAATGLSQARIPQEAAHLRAALIREGFPSEAPAATPEPPADTMRETSALAAPGAPGPDVAAGPVRASSGSHGFTTPENSTDTEPEVFTATTPGSRTGDAPEDRAGSRTAPSVGIAGAPESPTVMKPDLPSTTTPAPSVSPATSLTSENRTTATEPGHSPAPEGVANGDTGPFGRPLHEPPLSPVLPPREIPLPVRNPASSEPRADADPKAATDPGRWEPEPESEDWSAPTPAHRPAHHRAEALAVIGGLAAVLICFVWYFAGNHSDSHTDAGNRPAATSTPGAPPVPIPAAPLLPAPVAPAAAEAPAPQPDSGLFPQEARACYPFQADC